LKRQNGQGLHKDKALAVIGKTQTLDKIGRKKKVTFCSFHVNLLEDILDGVLGIG
jgi:hypothetical protein